MSAPSVPRAVPSAVPAIVPATVPATVPFVDPSLPSPNRRAVAQKFAPRRHGLGRSVCKTLVALSVAACLGFGAPAAPAQDGSGLTSLVADRVQAQPNGVLIAEGNVEVFYDGQRLRAGRVVYDERTDTLSLTGPLVLTDGPDVVILADEVELSGAFRDGLIRSARMVLNQQLQIAAAEINRVNGRYTQLYKTVASSCQVCASNPTPLWEIRASRIIHDQQARQLYFEDANLRIAGVPIAYLPRLRLPDPTLDRATGFLVPSFRTTDTLGAGIIAPYFIAIGQKADVTLTPYITANSSATLTTRYRQAFTGGEVDLSFAYTNDQLTTASRGFVQALGRFDLPAQFELTFDLEDVTDAGYYRDYGLPESDRIDSEIAITRVRRDQLIAAEATYYTSFRAGENNQTLPRLVGNAELFQRFDTPGIGGSAELYVGSFGYIRPSGTDVIGRDTARASVDLDWQRSFVSQQGLVTTVQLGASADTYRVRQDSTSPVQSDRLLPRAAVEFRFPVQRRSAGVTHILSPIVQLAWSADDPRSVKNDDSVLTELDEGNLFEFNRFSGRDRVEQGLRANLGLEWTRRSDRGWSMGAAIGRTLARDPHPDFTNSSGLQDGVSDWLTSVRLNLPNGFQLVNRAQFTNDFDVNKNALRLAWTTQDWSLNSTYSWLRADTAVGRPTETSELILGSRYSFQSDWTAQFDWQYDLSASSSRSAGLGLSYKTECVTVDFTLTRDFTSNATLQPTTDFGLFVSLDGFGGTPTGRPSTRSCGS